MSKATVAEEGHPTTQPPAAGPGPREPVELSRLGALATWIEAHPLAMRWILAGPVALIAAVVTMAAMPFWLPVGASGFDHVAIPVLVFPVIWAVAVIYPCLEDRLVRAALVMSLATLVQAILIAFAF